LYNNLIETDNMKNNILGHLALEFIEAHINQNHLLDKLVSNNFDEESTICLCDLEETLAGWAASNELDYDLFNEIRQKLPSIREGLWGYYETLTELVGDELLIYEDEVCWFGNPMSHKYLEMRELIGEYLLEDWTEKMFDAVFNEDETEVENQEEIIEEDLID